MEQPGENRSGLAVCHRPAACPAGGLDARAQRGVEVGGLGSGRPHRASSPAARCRTGYPTPYISGTASRSGPPAPGRSHVGPSQSRSQVLAGIGHAHERQPHAHHEDTQSGVERELQWRGKAETGQAEERAWPRERNHMASSAIPASSPGAEEAVDQPHAGDADQHPGASPIRPRRTAPISAQTRLRRVRSRMSCLLGL